MFEENDYFPSQDEIRSSLDKLSLRFQEVFDEFNTGNTIVSIDHLEIDIGRVKRWDYAQLFALICIRLKEKLSVIVPVNITLNSKAVPDKLHYEDDELKVKNAQDADNARSIPDKLHHDDAELKVRSSADANNLNYSSDLSDVEILTEGIDQHTYNAFLFFLRNGYLPWWGQKYSLKEIEQQVERKLFLKNKKLIGNLAELIMNEDILIRFLLQFSEKLQETIFIFLRKTSEDIHKRGGKCNTFKLESQNKIYRKGIISSIVPFIKSTCEYESIRLLNERQLLYFTEYQIHFNEKHAEIKSVIDKYLDDIFLSPEKSDLSPVTLQEIRTRYMLKILEILMQKKRINGLKDIVPEVVDISSDVIRKKLESSEVSNVIRLMGKNSRNLRETEIYIANAGLVILHPFLKLFFSNIGLLKQDKAFKGIEEKNRAIFLLNYIIYQQESYPEHELVLNKVLCGASVDEPVQNAFLIKEPEIKEIKSLLNSVIEHWEALKNTSPETLIDAFIKRNGKLTFRNHTYFLDVERKGIDILLSRMSWGISAVSLPWMRNLLIVNWI